MIKKLFILLLVNSLVLQAQNEFLYRQYVLNQLQFNPAYAGSREIKVASMISRAGMTGIDGFPKTVCLNIDAPMEKSSALGGVIMGEKIGNTDHYKLDFNYAYRIQFANAGKLSLGLKLSANIFTHRPLQNLADRDDDLFSETRQTYVLPNSGVGIYFYNFNKYFVGISVPSLLSFTDGGGRSGYSIQSDFVKMISNYHYIGSAGVVILPENDEIKIRLSGLFDYDISSSFHYDGNLMFIIKNMLWLGGSYFSEGVTTFMAQWQINPQMRVGYAYDYNISNNLKELGGGHEIMLRYEFRYIINAVSPLF